MLVIDLTQPLNTFLCIAVIIGLVFLGHELKNSIPPAIALGLSVLLIVMHAIQLYVFTDTFAAYASILSSSMIYDFAMILVSYLSYLWIDDIEAKYKNKKSLDDSLEWFWKKI